MNAPSDTIQGSPSFHYKIERVDNGFMATNVSLGPQVEPQIRETEREALEAAKAATVEWMGRGQGTQRG